MLAKWGIPAAALAACALVGLASGAGAEEQPTLPSVPAPPSAVPTLKWPSGNPPPSGDLGDLKPTKPSEPTSAGNRPPIGRPLLPESINIALKVERDGSLSVTEQVFVQARKTMTRHAPLRIQAGDDRDRVFSIRDVRVDGNGSTEVTGDQFVMTLGEGATTVTYTVDGAVTDVAGHQEVRWQVASGWDTKVRLLRASFIAPDQPESVVCLAGAFGSDSPCRSALTDSSQVLRVVQEGLPAGERVDLTVTLPAGTVGANARFDDIGTASAFALTTTSGVGLGALVLLLIGGFVLLWLARGRDARALAGDVGSVELLMTGDGGRVAFASPDGVLPGQVGTVVDERVDVADVTATVVDLAVRNYLSVRETGPTPGTEWVLVRRNPPDAALTDYERAVYQQVLGDAAEVPLTALRVDLTVIREALYTDVVKRQWFVRRPDHDRSLWSLVGVLLAVVGVAATVVLALTVGHALLGLALVVGGLGLALGARLMPARTKRGSVLVQQVRGLLNYLRTTDAATIPAADREMVLSRSLPYAVVLGEVDGWVRGFTDLDSGADGTPGIYWYESGDSSEFPARFAAFLLALDSALAR
ncbi:DUF2207 domain-containing protein [Actinophytocola algeriensis]|uniref:Membrane protein DUF2207 n=1 Tax=Actinophytocola algeriensis TaxID=1768010 RepID=A0A7W7VID9_9PSEU|nr:DUF2207 domain-containing protein [Actinophytocola algeriensis]MBB4911431.1 hypothetical protein [Actinophytocola algeriensis]MBE1479370.1 hypothetical protein [Actinophytocola algeriensis]